MRNKPTRWSPPDSPDVAQKLIRLAMQKEIDSCRAMSSRSIDGSEVPQLDPEAVFARFRECIPKLSHDMHKGQAGRIGVVGGCKEYTGGLVCMFFFYSA